MLPSDWYTLALQLAALWVIDASALARRQGCVRGVILAVFFMLFSPFFLLHASSYFDHPSCLLFSTLFVFFCARGIERQIDHDFRWAGLCGSVSFLIRPSDQIVAFCPLGVYLLVLVQRGHLVVRQIARLAIGHGVGVILLLRYNLLQSGHPLTVGYHVGSGQSLFELSLPGRHFIDESLLHFPVWALPLTLLANAVIFIRCVIGDILPWHLTRNPPDCSGKFLYVRDLAGLKHLLIG